MTDTRLAFDLSDEQEMIRDTVREFADGELQPGARERDETAAFPEAPIAALAELGMLGVCFPEDVGGADGDVLSLCVAIEQLARGCGSTALTFAAQVAFAAWPIHMLGSAEHRQQWLPGLCAGEVLGCLALADPAPAAGVSGSPLTATQQGDGWVLNGAKAQVVNAPRAGVAVVVTTGDPPAVFVVPTDTAGVSRGDRLTTLGMRGAEMCHLSFENVAVPAAARLSSGDAGAIETVLDVGRIALGALAIGLGEAALEMGTAYAVARKQFDTAIADFEPVSNRVGDSVVRLAAARHLVWHAARAVDAGRPLTTEAAIARLVAGEAAADSAFDAIQMFGGNGYSREYPIERVWRDARYATLALGTTENLRHRVARAMIDAVRG